MLKILTVIAGLILYATPANATEDPYMPDIVKGWCPGGSGVERVWGNHWCAGVDHPSGAFWQQDIRSNGKVYLSCRIHATDSLGTPKFARGCGRAV